VRKAETELLCTLSEITTRSLLRQKLHAECPVISQLLPPSSAGHGDPQRAGAVSAVEQHAGKRGVLPDGALPRGLSRVEAARYIGVGTSTFDAMVKGGTMPKPKTIGARRVWDKWKLDVAFSELPGDEDCGDDVWDQVS